MTSAHDIIQAEARPTGLLVQVEQGKLDDAIAEARARVKRNEKALVLADSVHDKALTKWRKLRPADLSKPETKAELQAYAKVEAAQKRAHGVMAALAADRRTLDKLQDPGELDRRIAVAQRLKSLRHTNGADGSREEGTMPAKKNNTEAAAQIRKETTTKIVALRKKGMGYPAIAKKLNEDKVPTFGTASAWQAPVVRGICIKHFGSVEKALEAAQPGKDKAAEKREADKAKAAEAKAAKAAEAEEASVVVVGEAEKVEVKPDPKPASKGKGRSSRKAPVAA